MQTSELFGFPVVLGTWRIAVGRALYRFEEYAIADRPAKSVCVYGLSRLASGRLDHLYFGAALDLPDHLATSATLDAALARGANRLLVLTPGFIKAEACRGAVEALVAAHAPPLNRSGDSAEPAEPWRGIG